MSDDAKSLLLEAIERDDGVGTFYICGSNYQAQLSILASVKESALHDGAGDFNYSELDARELPNSLLLMDILRFSPILSKRRVLIIQCADKMSSVSREGLGSYLNLKFKKELLLLLFNTPHTKDDPELAEDERIGRVVCN